MRVLPRREESCKGELSEGKVFAHCGDAPVNCLSRSSPHCSNPIQKRWAAYLQRDADKPPSMPSIF